MGKLALTTCALLALATQPRDLELQTSRLAVSGGEIVYDVGGSGPPVVFLHGAFMDRRSWDRQVGPFLRQFRVVRYDLRPFGESSRPAQAYSVPGDLLTLLDHLKIDRAHLVGHSFGGSVALDFALLHPDRVRSLTIAAAGPSGFVPPDDERALVAGIFAAVKHGDDAIVRAWIDHPMWSVARSRPDLRSELEASTRRNLAPFRLTFAPYLPVTPPAIERLADIRVPTLVIVGDRDMPGIRQSAELVARQVPGARMQIVAGADHALPLGWPEEFNAAVLSFIAAATR